METKTAPAAGDSGTVTAPAPQLQDADSRLILAVPRHLAVGNALLRRCLDLKSRTPGDTGLAWAAARLIATDAALGKQLAEALAAPGRKAKRKRRQSAKAEIAELNSRSSIFGAAGGPKDDQ